MSYYVHPPQYTTGRQNSYIHRSSTTLYEQTLTDLLLIRRLKDSHTESNLLLGLVAFATEWMPVTRKRRRNPRQERHQKGFHRKSALVSIVRTIVHVHGCFSAPSLLLYKPHCIPANTACPVTRFHILGG